MLGADHIGNCLTGITLELAWWTLALTSVDMSMPDGFTAHNMVPFGGLPARGRQLFE